MKRSSSLGRTQMHPLTLFIPARTLGRNQTSPLKLVQTRQLFYHCSPPSVFWPASFPLSNLGPCQGNFGYSVTGYSLGITKPSQPAVLNFERHIHTVLPLIQCLVNILVRPNKWNNQPVVASRMKKNGI